MPQTICSQCFAKLTPVQRRDGKLLCETCEAKWEKKLGAQAGTKAEPRKPAPVPKQERKSH